jgi:hypothetical protein
MINSIAIALLSALILVGRTAAFSSPRPMGRATRLDTRTFSSLKDPPKKEEEISTDIDGKAAVPDIDGKAPVPPAQEGDADGLPWWWELVWKLDIMKLGKPGEEVIFGDSANVLRTNIEQIYGGYPSLDGCPLAEGTGSNRE